LDVLPMMPDGSTRFGLFLARMFLDRLAASQMHFLQLYTLITINMNKRRC
jgi:hypothetical protein